MKLSTRSRYGTRILMELARHQQGEPVQVSRISRNQDIPVKYLEQLIRTLKQANLIKSFRGVNGGHCLAKMPSEISIGQIVRLFEGQTDLVKCISLPEACEKSDECRVRGIWAQATAAMYANLDSVTIADLVDANSSGNSLK